MSSVKRVLVYGGSGALGDCLVKHFASKNYWVASIDLKENPSASTNIIIDPNQSLVEQQKSIESHLSPLIASDESKLDAILNVAGGWAGGNAKDGDKLIASTDLMWKQSVWSSLIAASIASKYLRPKGVLTLPGAAAALNATPGMIGYGVAKAAVHQLAKSLAFNDAGENKSGLPSGAFVAAILPVTLDTPMNRKWMPKADTSTWTPLSYVVNLMDKWIDDEQVRPPSGSLVKLVTTDNNTDISLY